MATKEVQQVATVLRGGAQERRGESMGSSEQRRGSHAHARRKDCRTALSAASRDTKGNTKLDRRGTVLVRTAQALRKFPCQPNLLQQLRRMCCRAKHRHPALSHLDPAAPGAARVLHGCCRMRLGSSQRSDEEKRVDTWTLNMEADESEEVGETS